MSEEKTLRKRIAELSSTEDIVLAPLTQEDFEAFERGDLRYYWETKEMALKTTPEI